MAPIRSLMLRPPLAMEVVPGARAYLSSAMDRRITPYSRRCSPSSRSSTRWSHSASLSFWARFQQYHSSGLHQWRQRSRQIPTPAHKSPYFRWSSSWRSTLSSTARSGSTSTGESGPHTKALSASASTTTRLGTFRPYPTATRSSWAVTSGAGALPRATFRRRAT